MGSIAGDEGTPPGILRGHGHAQIPEAHMVELGFEFETRSSLDERVNVVIVRRSVLWHGCMEELAFTNVHSPEELPVAVQVRMHGTVGSPFRKALQSLMKLFRTEDGQHHTRVEVCPRTVNPQVVADNGAATVAANKVISLDSFLLVRPILLLDGDLHAVAGFLNGLRRPTRRVC